MSFLFKSKKQQSNGALPPATRKIHTAESALSGSTVHGIRDNDREGSSQSPNPPPHPNSSASSLNGASNGPEKQWRPRERAESDAPARRANINGQMPNAARYPWSQRILNFPTPQSNPFPRYGPAINATASKDGDIYMMGGLINGSMAKGDLWMVASAEGNLSCYSVATVSEGPGPRVGHSSLLVGNAFIVFGGDTKMDDSDALDDTLYLLNTSSRQWSRAPLVGPRPAGRYGHTLNILGSNIYIFGGQIETYFFNDLLAFDLNTLQSPKCHWEFLIRNSGDGGPAPGQAPAARTNHSVIGFEDRLYLFGGTNAAQWFNDVWSYDPRTNAWTQQECIGRIPAAREGHSAAVVGDVMYIYGGRTKEGNDLGDLAALRLTTSRWYTFQNMGPSPSPRSGHSMTSYGKEIIVLAGEPSSAPPDPSELSMVYILDTAKIQYPSNEPNMPKAEQDTQAGSQRPSTEGRNAIPAARSASSESQVSRAGHKPKSESGMRDTPTPVLGQAYKPVDWSQPGPTPNSRNMQSPVEFAVPGQGYQGQVSDLKANGSVPTSYTESQTRTPPKEPRGHGPPIDTTRALSAEGHRRTPSNRDSPKDLASKAARQASPEGQGRRTPSQPPALKAKAMEAGEAAPLISGPSRQRSLRSQRAHGSFDGSEEGLLGRTGSGRIHSGDGIADVRSLRSLGDEPKSPRLTAHQEALIKELEATKSRNAWYASELALARKAGFQSTASPSPTFDEKAVNQLGDEDRPLVEAFLSMRAEIGTMQQTVEQQAAAAAKQVAEIEHQRDAAVSEAAYARARLAAHSGSARGTPQPDSSRDVDDGAERNTDISRRLALALAAQNEHKAKLDLVTNDLAAEKRAREFAEESAEASQKRLEDLGEGRKPMELEALRAELHEVQSRIREESAQRARAEEKLSMSQVDRDEISQRHDDTWNRLQEHVSSLGALQAAVAASTDKANTVERHLEQEREQKESLERKLVSLRAEHEEGISELETTTRKLREVEEVAESHAKEASTHREALVIGLSKARQIETAPGRDAATEQRILVLQQSADRAHSLAKNNREAADLAAQKLRSAEERIAGLEAYQEQSNREGLQIRRQLQAARKDFQIALTENRDLKSQLENHQRDANALAIQHSALKDVLSERSPQNDSSARSPVLGSHSPGSGFGTPDQTRLREIEQQLQSSVKAHEETKSAFESREQEADRQYREKLEQLENDYQSAVHYVKGTEKMLKRMKDELSRYKTQNNRLESELENFKSGDRVESRNEEDSAKVTAERDGLQKTLEDMQKESGQQIATLESQMSSIRAELSVAQAERDQHRSNHEELSKSVQDSRSELSQMKSENSLLESRAMDAEEKVSILLDQVGQSVGNYRRQSQIQPGPASQVTVNGNLNRQSTSSMVSSGEADSADPSSSQGEMFADNRGSVALDTLASELDALKTRWESTSRSYRLSNQFDFEKTPTKDSSGAELTENLARWRKRLEEEESGAANGGAVREAVSRDGPTTG